MLQLTCSTFISPLYINSTKYLMSMNFTSFRMMMGSFSLLQFVRMESKYVLHADNTTRCAFNVCPSHASVTSQKQPRSRSCENIVCRLLWWYFHLRQYCCGNILACGFLLYVLQLNKERKVLEKRIMTNNYEKFSFIVVHAWLDWRKENGKSFLND